MYPPTTHGYKVHKTKKHKSNQLLNNVVLYSLTTLSCASFCSSPLWYPPFCAAFNVFVFLSLPRIASFFFTSKVLFIVVNLIVIFLLGESRFFSSSSKSLRGDFGCDRHKRKNLKVQVLSLSEKSIVKHSLGQEMTRVKNPSVSKEEVDESYDEDEFFESCDDERNCESNVEEKNIELSYEHEEEIKGARVVEEEKHGLESDGEVSFACDDLNKLVDDFIARVNRQRRLEDEFCRG